MVVFGYSIPTKFHLNMEHKITRSAKDKYVLLSEFGSKHNLRFSSHLALGNRLIALDGIRKVLLVSEASNEMIEPYFIDLTKVAAISFKKSYGSIGSGELETKEFEEFLRSIDLQFEFYDKNDTGVVTFYEREIDEIRNLPRLEKNAKSWQRILSKLVVPQAEKTLKGRNKLVSV